VSFHVSSGDGLDGIPSTCADFVVAYNVFQHLPNVRTLQDNLREMTRVAKPNAIIVFTLSTRTYRDLLLPLLRFRRYLLEMTTRGGPRGLYKSEWVGIRPSQRTVRSACDIPLSCTMIHNNKWLFYGTKPSTCIEEA
jgi:ubiquinone/menaquinone biosynthesis C-methylase UbiE